MKGYMAARSLDAGEIRFIRVHFCLVRQPLSDHPVAFDRGPLVQLDG